MTFPHHDPFYCPSSAIASSLDLPIIPMRDYERVSFTIEVSNALNLDCRFSIKATNVGAADKARFALTSYDIDITEDGVYHLEAPLTCIGAFLLAELKAGSGRVVVTALARS